MYVFFFFLIEICEIDCPYSKVTISRYMKIYFDYYACDITAGSDTVPKPAIEWAANQHFVVGYDIILNCSLIWKDNVVFRWELPNPYAVSNLLTKQYICIL